MTIGPHSDMERENARLRAEIADARTEFHVICEMLGITEKSILDESPFQAMAFLERQVARLLDQRSELTAKVKHLEAENARLRAESFQSFNARGEL